MNCLAAAAFSGSDAPPRLDSWEVLIDAILAEATSLTQRERSSLAARILELGGYQSADEPSSEGRAALAIRLAARLSALEIQTEGRSSARV